MGIPDGIYITTDPPLEIKFLSTSTNLPQKPTVTGQHITSRPYLHNTPNTMRSSITLFALVALQQASSTPLSKRQDFSNIQYPPGTGADLHEYSPGTGENLHEYPPGTGENLHEYPPGTGGTPPNCPPVGNPVIPFTSTFHVLATPDQVVNGTTNPVFTGGLEGAQATYDFGINVDLDLICYNIRLTGFRGEYQSPARTATHVHEAARGRNGPPRLAFPNPMGDGDVRTSVGCMMGEHLPFPHFSQSLR